MYMGRERMISSEILCHPVHRHSFVHGSSVLVPEKRSMMASIFTSKATSIKCIICCKSILPDTAPHVWRKDAACLCLLCGVSIHRGCLSRCQSRMQMDIQVPVCQALTITDTNSQKNSSIRQSNAPSKLMEDFSLWPVTFENGMDEQKTIQHVDGSFYLKKYAPYVAGGVLSAVAAGATVIGFPVVAGISLGAAAATGAKDTYSSRREKNLQQAEQEWARRICWDIKQKMSVADSSYKQDAALVRKYQTTPPTAEEVYNILYAVFASKDEFVGTINAALCEKFRERFSTRRTGANDPTHSNSQPYVLCSDTVRDAKVYIGHILAVTMNTYSAFTTTEQGIQDCTKAVEKIVYSDIYGLVFSEFQQAFQRYDAILRVRIFEIKSDRKELFFASSDQVEQSAVRDALQV